LWGGGKGFDEGFWRDEEVFGVEVAVFEWRMWVVLDQREGR